MARAPRLQFKGAFYHVVTRGNGQNTIFYENRDYQKYLDILGRSITRYGFYLYGYALMPNHVHLLLEQGDISLSRLMQSIQTAYAQYFNNQYDRTGHVFQGRYKALICDRDSYLLELIRYVHMNPVRANLVRKPEEYPWTSHRAYLGIVSLDCLCCRKILEMFGGTYSRSIESYKRFILDGLKIGHEERFYETEQPGIIGEGKFVEKIRREYTRRKPSIPLGRRETDGEKVESIIDSVSKVSGIAKAVLKGSLRRSDIIRARDMVMGLGREWFGVKPVVVAEVFRRDRASVTRAVHRFVRGYEQDSKVREQAEKIIKKLMHQNQV